MRPVPPLHSPPHGRDDSPCSVRGCPPSPCNRTAVPAARRALSRHPGRGRNGDPRRGRAHDRLRLGRRPERGRRRPDGEASGGRRLGTLRDGHVADRNRRRPQRGGHDRDRRSRVLDARGPGAGHADAQPPRAAPGDHLPGARRRGPLRRRGALRVGARRRHRRRRRGRPDRGRAADVRDPARSRPSPRLDDAARPRGRAPPGT